MKIFTPEQLAAEWSITEKEVMMKIYHTFRVQMGFDKTKKEGECLPEKFEVIRVDSDHYNISVPDDYIFLRQKKTRKRS